MISPFGKLIVVIMLWLHRYIPSYGLVIVVFAVLVRIVTWPLTTKSYRSIRAMQELQPEIQAIRERHKQDFLDHVDAESRHMLGERTEPAVRAVFEVMWDKVDPGEIAKLIELFPAELRDLWPRLARMD